MNAHSHDVSAEFHELYDTYVKPIEAEHLHEYVAVEPGGRMIFGKDLRQVSLAAIDTLNKGSFVYKVGQRFAGRWC